MILTYHLESENRNTKNFLVVCLRSAKKIVSKEGLLSLAANSSEKSILEQLIKELGKLPISDRIVIAPERAFTALKALGTTGRLFYQEKKVVVDPFTPLDFHLTAERRDQETVLITGSLQKCEWIFAGDPSFVLQAGILRPIREEIGSNWIRFAMKGPQLLKGVALSELLSNAEGEVPVVWLSGEASVAIDPIPFLKLTDRHGGFADLWFDYGAYGKIPFHEQILPMWRNKEAEKEWEKDLLETDFRAKIVDKSHYYCPLDKVAKSLTFLLEIGWILFDASGRQVVRQKQTDFDADFREDKILIRGKIHYDTHPVDLKDLVGVFNRREHFIELSPDKVALFDREDFSRQWGDFTEHEITSEGIAVRKNHFGLLESLLGQNFVREDLKEKIKKMARCEPSSEIEPGKGFLGTLFSYQKEGLQWLKFLQEGGFGGLLADEMGLGKTVQVLAFFSQFQIHSPCLIVVPTSLLFNWQREIEKFLPGLCIYRHEGKQRLSAPGELQKKQIILTSYALMRIDADVFQEIDYQIIVLDEGQAIKNADSQIARVVSSLKAAMRLVITGTPIENRVEDLWSLFHFLQPDLLGEKREFQTQMLNAQMGVQFLERIKKKIRPFLLRRRKDQVALQLPPKIEQTIFVEMTESQAQIYDRWLSATRQGLLKKVSLDGAASHRMEILEAILRLRQISAHPWLVEERREEDPALFSAKFERLFSDLQEVVEQKQKVLVYSQFTSMLHLMETTIREKGWKYVYLDGSSKDREGSVRQFQEDPETAIFLISLKAGGVGLNLTAADYVFLYDPWWNEATERQAIDRAHRLGRAGTVIARRYVTALSIEEKIMRLKDHKTTLSQHLLDVEGKLGELSLDDLLELLS